ncbi:MAG: exopolygalacturonase [Bacteroidales bacterium]|nr:exopolygalacturonase [Bacteroidales bacterium]
MKKFIVLALTLLLGTTVVSAKKQKAVVETWPNGEVIDSWFYQTNPVNVDSLGKKYKLTDYHINADGRIHTQEIQALIDQAAANGGGVIVVPSGVFMTGGLYFKQGTHLYLDEGAVLMGSDFIGDYKLAETRMEGETCLYFEGLINAIGLDGFTISGKGTIDGNGLRYHQQFWLRRKWNRKCTNKDEQRPRLVWISNCKNVQLEGVSFQNSPFWTTHIYNSDHVKLLNLHIYSLLHPDDSKGPSTDAIDLDVTHDILVKGCYMSVNDDAVAIKGGKGPYADAFEKEYPGVEIPSESKGNGANYNILITDCVYGEAHGCLTVGSESVHSWNIILRNIDITNPAYNLLWLKMRPDTPQRYEYITVENITGSVRNFLHIAPWKQFFDLKGRQDAPMSYSDHITMRNCNVSCRAFFSVTAQPEVYKLSNFTLENLDIKSETNKEIIESAIEGITQKNVTVK